MRAIAILQVDAFTDRPFAGNPAGVVLDGAGLSEAEMQRIAAEMSLAATAFVSSPARPEAPLRLRWFTPARELTYCGHATVATVHAMVEAGRLHGRRSVFDTLGGTLAAAVEPDEGGVLVWLEPAVPDLAPFSGPLEEILEALGTRRASLGDWARPALTPERDLLLPAGDLKTLHGLAPDMSRLGKLGETLKIRGACMLSLETVEPGSATHCRFFAPHFGIPEDIVSGSVHSSIAVWLWAAGRLEPAGGRAAFTAEQGDVLGRPGRLRVELDLSGGQPSRVRVGGRAVTVLSGSLRIG
ncbi:MAG TPA: PhzF family phenazine biosynthesis protein [Methylomirabilota bacterium]|nr:PhzF family phenazine biosynthesis protein [Methylomirabilota bacterium]